MLGYLTVWKGFFMETWGVRVSFPWNPRLMQLYGDASEQQSEHD